MLAIPRVLKSFASHLASAGHECYLVGGAIRDMLLGLPAEDFDIATDARPEEVMAVYRRVIPTGIKHGTVTVFFKGHRLEVTTFRVEEEYRDGRRPESVRFTPSIEEDLGRRDFTINAIAYDLIGSRLLDPYRGREDLKAGVIRAIGDPDMRFQEDGLRPVRACRFAAQFDFRIDPQTLAGIRRQLDTVRKVSAERIRDELSRLLASASPSVGFRLMQDSGLLALVLPELSKCVGVEQRERHCFDVFEHSLASCDAAPRNDLALRLAALLHDIGKPACRQEPRPGELTFHRHELVSAEMSERILRRLRFSNAVVAAVTHLVRHHMFNYEEHWSDAAVRRFVARVGREQIPALLALRRADQVGRCGSRDISPGLIAFEDRIQAVLAARSALSRQDLAVSGRDVMEALGIPPGPQVGRVLEELMETVLADPHQNRKEPLLRIARRFYEERLSPGRAPADSPPKPPPPR